MAKQGLYPLPKSLEEWGVMTAAWQIFYGPLFRPEPHPHPQNFWAESFERHGSWIRVDTL